MLLRVSCDYPCFVRADGVNCGRIDGEPKYLTADAVLECSPLSGAGALPVCLDLSAPTINGVTVTDYGELKDYLIRIPRLPTKGTEVLFQQAVATPRGKILVTAIRDGTEKITIDGQGLFGVFDLPCGLSAFRAEYGEIATVPCLSVLGRRASTDYAFVYDLSLCRLLFQGRANEVQFGQTLITTSRHHTLARHTVTTEWDYAGGRLSARCVTAVRRPTFDFLSLLPFSKPYALAEEVLVGGNPVDFLSAELQESADCLPSYLGAFTAVLPPPALCHRQGAALIYPTESGNTAKFLTVDFCGGKIDNISLAPQ